MKITVECSTGPIFPGFKRLSFTTTKITRYSFQRIEAMAYVPDGEQNSLCGLPGRVLRRSEFADRDGETPTAHAILSNCREVDPNRFETAAAMAELAFNISPQTMLEYLYTTPDNPQRVGTACGGCSALVAR